MSFEKHVDVVSTPSPVDTSSFDTLGLAPEIVRSIGHAGYPSPTEVQSRTVPQALAGHDLMVSSQTGSGKTAAFVWPALQRVLNARNDPAKRRAKGQAAGPRVLVLAPTRELAMQVSRAFSVYGHGVAGLRVAHVVGGVPYHAQLKALRGPLDILIATPGRLLDLMRSGSALVAQVELLILDEADRMLDMGFIDDITTIAQALPEQRQTMMFSATFAGNVGTLARQLTRDPQRISVDSHTDTHASIEQRLHWADSLHHKHALLEQLLADRGVDQAVVFTSTQRDADDLAYKLGEIGHSVAALHGGMPQGRRNRVLQGLRSRQLRVLVATDVAARGIDVPTITHVINYGLPMKAEDYVHRIGRTGRAGRAGLAITLAERRDVGMIRRIERFTTQPITTAVLAGLEPKLPEPSATKPAFAGRGRPSFGNRGGFGAPHGGHAAPHGGNFGGHGAPHGGHGGNFGGNFGARGGNGGGFQGDRPFQDRAHADRPHGGQGGFRDDNRSAAGQFDRGHGSPARPTRSFAGKPPAFGPRRTPR
jgi:superfamily II DNA/RNA helicase